MELMQIIIKPYLTEKTYSVRNSGNKKEVIALLVHPKANKNDIKKAFESIYEIKPESVNTITRKPVSIRTGTRNPGLTKLTKIAYVTLPEGTKLAITEEEIESAKDTLKQAEKVKEVKEVKENKSKKTTSKSQKL